MTISFQRLVKKKTNPTNIFDRIIQVCLWLIVFCIPLFFLPLTTEPFEINKMFLFCLLVLIAGITWLLKLVVRHDGTFQRTPFDIPVVIFVLFSLLALVFSLYRYRSLVGVSGYFSGSFVGTLFFILFFYLVVNTIRREQISRLLTAFFLSGAILVLFNFFQVFALHLLPWDFTKVVSFNALSNSPVTFSVYLAILVLFSVFRLLASIRKVDRHPLEQGLTSLLGIVSLFLMLVYDQPIGWCLLILGLLLFVIFQNTSTREYSPYALILPTVIIGFSLLSLFVNTQTLLGASLPGDVLLSQGYGWKVTVDSVMHNPFVGFGEGTFQAVFARFRPLDFNNSAIWSFRFMKSSNEWFQLLSTVGVFAALAFFSVVALYVWRSFRSMLKTPYGETIWWTRLHLLIGGLLWVALLFFVPSNFITTFFLWLFLGLGVISWKEKEGASPAARPTRGNGGSFGASLGFSLVAILAIVFLYFGGRIWLADVKVAKANIDVSKKADLGVVRTTYANAIDLNPSEITTYFDLAQNLLVQAQLEAQKKSPNVDQVRSFITTSAAAGQEGAAHFPKDAATYEALSKLYQDIDTLAGTTSDETKKAFAKAIELEPNNPQLYMNYGQYDLVVARQKAAQASAKDAKNPDTQLMKDSGTALTDASKMFAEAAKRKTNYLDAQLNSALVLRLQNKGDEAVKKLEKLASQNPYQVDVLFNLGENYLIDKRTADAEAVFQRIVTVYPGYSDAHYRLSQIYEERGDKAKAISELEIVQSINPDITDVKTKIAELKGTK